MNRQYPLFTNRAGVHLLTPDCLRLYRAYLMQNEYAEATIKAYLRTAGIILNELPDSVASKETMLALKRSWIGRCSTPCINANIAAANSLMEFLGWPECKLKPVRVQTSSCRKSKKELTEKEYHILLETARARGQKRLYYIIETLCSTGIRVSELRYITVDAIQNGRAEVSNKGKTRIIFLPKVLCTQLLAYCAEKDIRSGSVFISYNGRPLDRSNIWEMMKRLCAHADIDPEKVYPHNLRHLFACKFYQNEHDLDHLAVILGHSSINTTRIYTRTNEAEYQKQIDRMKLTV